MDTIIEYMIMYFVKEGIIPQKEKEIYFYGAKNLLLLCINIGTLMICAYFENLFEVSVVFLLSFACLRAFAGGYHAQTAAKCYFGSVFIFQMILMDIKISSHFFLMIAVHLMCTFIAIPILFKYAPSETGKRAITDGERNYFKIKLKKNLFFTYIFIGYFLIVQQYDLVLAICLGILLETLLVVIKRKEV